MYYLLMYNEQDDLFVRLVKSNDPNILIVLILARNIEAFPNFTMSDKANYNEEQYVEVKVK